MPGAIGARCNRNQQKPHGELMLDAESNAKGRIDERSKAPRELDWLT